jgi:transposase-like protein
MSRERRKFSREFKIKVVQAYESGVSAVELSRQFELHPNVIYGWSREYRKDPSKAFQADHDDSTEAQDQRIAELERMVGRLSLENDFLKKALSHAKNILSTPKPGSMKP